METIIAKILDTLLAALVTYQATEQEVDAILAELKAAHAAGRQMNVDDIQASIQRMRDVGEQIENA